MFHTIIFMKSNDNIMAKTLFGFLLLVILTLSFCAFRVVVRGFPYNYPQFYKTYLISKAVYNIASLFQVIVLDLVNCFLYKDNISQDSCTFQALYLKFILGSGWIIYEYYLCYIVYIFYLKSANGRFGPIGERPIFDLYILSRNTNIHFGIVLETKGLKCRIIKSKIIKAFPHIQNKKKRIQV